METETLDKLYLEISQFTKAKTAREIALEDALKAARDFIDSHVADPDITPEMHEKYTLYLEALARVKNIGWGESS